MTKFVLASLLLTYASGNVLAQTSTMPTESLQQSGVDDHSVAFGFGLAYGAGSGGQLSYSRRVSSHFNLGLAYFAKGSGQDVGDNSEGSLADATYYENEIEVKSEMFELNTTYYFRQNGAVRWGALLRGGIGYAKRQVTLESKRYDDNVGFWGPIFGSDKNLLETNNFSDTWHTLYTRIGSAYQFAWVPQGQSAKAGHILELGLSAFIPTQRESIRYTKNDGSSATVEEDSVSAIAEISYKILF